MSKSLAANRRNVFRVICRNTVTGTDLDRCADSIVNLLGGKACQRAKVREILEILVKHKCVTLNDACLRRTMWAEASYSRIKKTKKPRYPRDKMLAHLDVGACQPDPTSSVPPAWRGCDPDDYVSKNPSLTPCGGWDDDAVFDEHLRVSARRGELAALAAAQFVDCASSHGVVCTASD